MSSKMRQQNPPRPRIAWKTTAVAAKDPLAFAAELQTALQELTDKGFNIVSQIQRDGAIIITGQRVEIEGGMQAFESMVPQPQPPGPRRIVQPARHPLKGMPAGPTSEVLYHFVEGGRPQQKSFPTMLEALRLVQTHIGDPSGDPVVPVCLVSVSMTQYELAAFPVLLKAHAEELRATNDKLPG